jgi:hypothetical protein
MLHIRNMLLGFFALLLLIAIGVSAASAQDDDGWSVWLYDFDTGTFTHIASTGETVEQIDVPHNAGYDWYSHYSEVSPDGQTVAYGEAAGDVLSADMDFGSFAAQLALYNVNTDEVIATYPLNPESPALGADVDNFDRAANSLTFNEDGSQVVFGYSYNYDPANDDVYHWEIVVLDANRDAEPLYKLSSITASAQLGTEPTAEYDLFNFEYTGSTVQFIMNPSFIRADLSAVNVTWNVETNELDVLPLPEANFFGDEANGLRVELVMDDTKSLPESMGMVLFNDLMLVDRDGNEKTLLQDVEVEVFEAHFVQGGELILAHVMAEGEQSLDLLLDLDGNVVQTFDDLPPSDIWATPDGFLYRPLVAMSLYSVNLRDGGDHTLMTDRFDGLLSLSVVPSGS